MRRRRKRTRGRRRRRVKGMRGRVREEELTRHCFLIWSSHPPAVREEQEEEVAAPISAGGLTPPAELSA